MAILFSDNFDRVAGSLGNGWNEVAGPGGAGNPGTANFSTDGDIVSIDTDGVFHVAIAPNTSQDSQYLQCWLRSRTGNTAGLVWRYKDVDNFYYMFLNPTATPAVSVFRRTGGTNNLIATTSALGLFDVNNFNFVAITMIGTAINIYLNGTYHEADEGPRITEISNHITGVGMCGITTSGNNATGNNGPQWNDFLVSDGGRGDVVYIHSSSALRGLGTVADPLPGIAHGLNSVACIAGSTLKFVDAGPYTNTADIPIGHANKFNVPGFVYPTYSDDTGEVLDEGTPNLVIEGVDGASRTLLQETTALQPYFRIRSGCAGIVFRGLNFEATSRLRAVYTESSALPLDHSFSLDKCYLKAGPNGGAGLCDISAGATAIRMVYCHVEIPAGVTLASGVFEFLSNAGVRSSHFRMNLIDGNADFPFNYTQLMPTWQSGDVHDIDHVTYRTHGRATTIKAISAILQPNLIAAGSRHTVQNSITFIDAPAVGIGYGVYYGNTNSPSGTMEEHHNGFDGLDMDACTGPPGNASTSHLNTTCNVNAGNSALDPQFNNPTGTFTWLHTAGAGLNGEGTFAALVVPDLRVNNVTDYKDRADDSSPLQAALDKGALQDYTTPTPTPAGSDESTVVEDVYCVSVRFDPGGDQETDLSAYFRTARPIRMEKDVLVRRYRANDVELIFSDPDELFVESNPLSFLIDPVTGEPEWIYKRVEVVAQIGGLPLLRFVGFVLDIDVAREGARMRIANRFQELTDREVKANTFGKVVSTTGATGVGTSTDPTDPQAPASGTFLGSLDNLGDWAAGFNNPPAQTFTVTFHDGGSASTFSISGSKSGFEGTGQLSVPFSWVSATNYLSINTDTGGSFIVESPGPSKGQTCSFEVLWRPTPNQTIIDAFLEFLASPLGADLDPDEIATETFAAVANTVADQALPNMPIPANTPRMAATEGNVLDALTSFARHCGCVLIETSRAALGISSFLPRTVSGLRETCYSVDLMKAEITHLPVYNEFTIQHTFEERTQQYGGGGLWPPAAENDSFQRYGRRLPAPESLAFRGYDAGNAYFCEIVAQALYVRHRNPAPVIPVTLTVDYLDAELTDIYRVESLVPTMTIPFCDPAVIEKNIVAPLTAYAELVRTDNVDSDECGGFLAYDDDDRGYDDECWGYF